MDAWASESESLGREGESELQALPEVEVPKSVTFAEPAPGRPLTREEARRLLEAAERLRRDRLAFDAWA